MKFLCVGFEDSRSVALGINRYGVEKDVFAHAVAEQLVNLGELGSFKRAGLAAFGVNKIDQDDFAFQHIVIKVDGFSILCDERYVGEIIRAPIGVVSSGRRYADR